MGATVPARRYPEVMKVFFLKERESVYFEKVKAESRIKPTCSKGVPNGRFSLSNAIIYHEKEGY
jgi:hypothetical protein